MNDIVQSYEVKERVETKRLMHKRQLRENERAQVLNEGRNDSIKE